MQQQCLKDPNKDIGLDFGLDLDLKLGVWSEDKKEAREKHKLMPNECNNSASSIQMGKDIGHRCYGWFRLFSFKIHMHVKTV